ncbi:hypothetical protein RBG61_04010 [Paludicola sp. MB14-C6]|uniref:hypothetical protein n=1 Tax=Paludihabitans sp. MB14-C6 TaxID=3070656 RepID=UPI0027DC5637|nr:hypothetical protein [Paludicola sp. MB14-C6]WMJ23839.1 hypothetical protein RBG61_04010 [Paludicola sp. MB14-C6]
MSVKSMKALLITSCIVIVFLIGTYVIAYQQTPSLEALRLEKVIVNSDYIQVSGFHYGGLFNYVGYTTQYNNGNLYIKFKGGWWLPWMEETNSPAFYPVYNKYRDELTNVYLYEHSIYNAKLIWNKEQGQIIKK